MIYKIIGNLDCRVIKFVVFCFVCIYIFGVYVFNHCKSAGGCCLLGGGEEFTHRFRRGFYICCIGIVYRYLLRRGLGGLYAHIC